VQLPNRGYAQKKLKRYCEILRHDFVDNNRRHERMDLQRFKETAKGRDWEGAGSMVMALFGRNENSSSTFNSWLSPVAAELAEGLLNSDDTVAYEGCCSSDTLDVTISRIIFQLLEKNPALVRRAQDYEDIESQISRAGNSDERISALRTALSRIINLHDSRVYIILDRPELATGNTSRYITTMLSLMRDLRIELKILLVVRSELFDFEANKYEIDTDGIDANTYQMVCINQRRRSI